MKFLTIFALGCVLSLLSCTGGKKDTTTSNGKDDNTAKETPEVDPELLQQEASNLTSLGNCIRAKKKATGATKPTKLIITECKKQLAGGAATSTAGQQQAGGNTGAGAAAGAAGQQQQTGGNTGTGAATTTGGGASTN